MTEWMHECWTNERLNEVPQVPQALLNMIWKTTKQMKRIREIAMLQLLLFCVSVFMTSDCLPCWSWMTTGSVNSTVVCGRFCNFCFESLFFPLINHKKTQASTKIYNVYIKKVILNNYKMRYYYCWPFCVLNILTILISC